MLLFLLYVVGTAAQTVNKNNYFKVDNILPISVESTILASVSFSNSNNLIKYVCLSLCTRTVGCSLGCFDETDCNVYSTLVSRYWDSTTFFGSEKIAVLQKCYTSWQFPTDITNQITVLSASSVKSGPAFLLEHATNGIYTIERNGITRTDWEDNPYFTFEFDQIVKITSIIIKVKFTPQFVSGFEDIIINVGNSTTSYVPFGGHFTQLADSGAIILFSNTQPTYGKLIKIMRMSVGFVALADVKVLG